MLGHVQESDHASERRRHPRRPAGDLAGRVGFSQPMRILDLSVEGARVSTGESLAPRRRYHVQVAGLHLTAAVARCVLERLEPDERGSRPVFVAGLAFDAVTAPQRKQLRRLLARLPAAAARPASPAETTRIAINVL
jgi:hypothetical protein